MHPSLFFLSIYFFLLIITGRLSNHSKCSIVYIWQLLMRGNYLLLYYPLYSCFVGVRQRLFVYSALIVYSILETSLTYDYGPEFSESQ